MSWINEYRRFNHFMHDDSVFSSQKVRSLWNLIKAVEEFKLAWSTVSLNLYDTIDEVVARSEGRPGDRILVANPYTDTVELDGELYRDIDHLLVLAFLILERVYFNACLRRQRPRPKPSHELLKDIADLQVKLFGGKPVIENRRQFERKIAALQAKHETLGACIEVRGKDGPQSRGPSCGYVLVLSALPE